MNLAALCNETLSAPFYWMLMLNSFRFIQKEVFKINAGMHGVDSWKQTYIEEKYPC